jgi:hypothetical protein
MKGPEQKQMDDNERFRARRGTHGGWHWQGRPPPEPGPFGPSLLSRLRASLSKARAAAAGWVRSAIAGFNAAASRLRRPGAPQQAPDVEPTSAEPANGWAPPPQPASVPPAPTMPITEPDVPPSRIPLVDRLRENRPRAAVPWSRIALPRPKLNLRRPELAMMPFRGATIRDDLRAPLAVFAGLVLAAAVAVVAIVAIEALDGGSGSSSVLVSDVTRTPAPTETVSPAGTPTPIQSPAPATQTPAPQTAAPQTAAPTPVTPATSPQGAVSVAYWSNRLNEWWFGDLTDSVANYEEGQNIPFMVRWDGVAGATYWLRIVYDCQTPNTFGTIDYLSGLQDWGSELLSASYGPGPSRPNGAIPVPDTPNFAPDNNNVAVFTLYGAKFPVLPLPPHPDANCNLQRTQDLPIQAYGGTITFLGSGHLGTATVYSSGKGASSAKAPFGLHITVDGAGRADVMVDPSAIADIAR